MDRSEAEERMKKLAIEGDTFINAGNHAEAAERYREAIQIAKDASIVNPFVGNLFNNMGSALLVLERYDESLAAFKLAIEINKTHGAEQDTTNSYTNLGNLFCLKSMYAKALSCYKRSLVLIGKYHQEHDMIAANTALAVASCLAIMERRAEGLQYLEWAERLYTALGDSEKLQACQAMRESLTEDAYSRDEQSSSEADELFEKARNAENSNDLKGAIELYMQCINVLNAQDIKDSDNVARCYNNMGTCYNGLADFDMAIDCLDNALSIYKKLDNLLEIANIKSRIGAIEVSRHRFKEAKPYIDAASSLFESLHTISKESIFCLFNRGIVVATTSQKSDGIAIMKKAVALARENNERELADMMEKFISEFDNM